MDFIRGSPIRATIRNRGPNTWQLTFEQTTRGQGRNRKYRTVKGSKRYANSVKDKMLLEMTTGNFCESNNMTVRELMKVFEEMKFANKSPTTIRGYKNQIHTYIDPELGDIAVQNLSIARIQKWVNDLSSHSPSTGKPLSARTVKNIFLNLSAALSMAVDYDIIPKNPCKKVILPKIQKTHTAAFDKNDIDNLAKAAIGSDMEFPIMVELALGLRRGELLALRWDNVDFEKRIIHIIENRVEGENGEVVTKAPKSESGIRDLPLTESLLALFKKQSEYCTEIATNNLKKKDYVIVKDNGDPYMPHSFTKRFKHFLKSNDLKDIRFHDMRHMNATLLLEKEVNPKVVQQRLGHSEVGITLDIYSHVLDSVNDAAAQKIDDALFKE